jgi:hypothetical protein
MSSAKHYSVITKDWPRPMEAGGIVALLVSITFGETRGYTMVVRSINEYMPLDKCEEEGCMNLKQYYNAKTTYFKYCQKRKLSPTQLNFGVSH